MGSEMCIRDRYMECMGSLWSRSLASNTAGGDAAVAPPSTRQLVQNVPGCRWFGLLVKVWPIRIFAGGAGAGAGVVVPVCTVKAVVGVAGAGVAASASMRGSCPGEWW